MRRWLFWMVTALVLAVLPATALARDESMVRVTLPGNRALRFGDRGQAVADLQRLLRNAGFDPGRVDGVFGPLTEGAVKRAQQRLGLTVDGKAGNLTIGAVQAAAEAAAQGDGAAPAAGAGAGAAGPSHMLVVHHAAESGVAGQAGAMVNAVVSRDERRFALTFNGAPDPALLPKVLDSLQRHGMQATFFLYGQTAEQSPDLVAHIAAAGHEVASNGAAAVDMAGLSVAQMEQGLRQASGSIKGVTGTDPVYFRPPLGRLSAGLARAAEAQGLKLSLWTNVTVQDDPELSPTELADQLAGTVYPGAVIMLHQDRATTVQALDLLLDKLQANGYHSVALSEIDRP